MPVSGSSFVKGRVTKDTTTCKDTPAMKPWREFTLGELADFMENGCHFELLLTTDKQKLVTDCISVFDEPPAELVKALACEIHEAKHFAYQSVDDQDMTEASK